MRKWLLPLAVMGIIALGCYYYTQGAVPTQAQTHIITHAHTTHTVARINQLDPAQYYPAFQDYSLWSPSTCSSAAMTEVINYYGHHYKLGDILKVEAGLYEITPDVGLIEPQGIDRTVAVFGFQTRWLKTGTLNQVLTVANGGHPVIIGFPPETWAGGHLLVVIGGTTLKGIRYVHLADSSRLNMAYMLEPVFKHYWRGFAVEVYPKGTHA